MKTSDELLRAARADEGLGNVLGLCAILNLITVAFAISADARATTILFAAMTMACGAGAWMCWLLADSRRRRALGDDA